ncbi:hypothetical protein BV25DRAFT_1107077 [Artomyces pyxidatus]|uniref:Uncharacterized protein n=1 Tax=Artomyces pyxidatus TaxID=48021 RepID=A0ACB8TGC2_9AGAM|nr:hypothetical protein BV25DRAFT_1107077 [Artomyces pyxidatus]
MSRDEALLCVVCPPSHRPATAQPLARRPEVTRRELGATTACMASCTCPSSSSSRAVSPRSSSVKENKAKN